MSASYLLAIDQGTTGTKVGLVDLKSFKIHIAYQEIRQHYPKPGWVEHHPQEILDSVYWAVKKVARQSSVRLNRIASIGITNQRETVVAWDRRNGRPVCHAIVWQDRRTHGLCEKLKRNKSDQEIREKTGLLSDPYFSATKMSWILKNIPEARILARKGSLSFGTIDSWILWNLTGGRCHATDYTNASRTLLFDIDRLVWDRGLMRMFGVPENSLPEIKRSSDFFGSTEKIGPFPKGLPIHAMIGDQQSALFGQNCCDSGSMKNTYGTGCFLMMNTGRRRVNSRSGLLTTIACDSEGGPAYALEGSVFIAGAVVQWLRDGLGLIQNADESEAKALSVKNTDGVVMIPAFVGLGAPYWDSRCRGAILGLTRGTRKEHLIRAALESIAYQTVNIVKAMVKDSGIRLRELRVDGGATRNVFLMQFQADILRLKLRRSSMSELTAWGVAKLAACGAGIPLKGRKINAMEEHRTFNPRMKPGHARALYAAWTAGVKKILSKKA